MVGTPLHLQRGREIHLQHVYADDKGRAMKSVRVNPIAVDDFGPLYERRRKNPMVVVIELQKLFESIKNHQITVALKEGCFERNQNSKSLPYDYNRVSLKYEDGTRDYINASYIRDHSGKFSWIVTQGPKDNTIEDFWQLVWQEKSPIIVMLTRTYEMIQLLCSQYWPKDNRNSAVFGQYTVTVVDEEKFSDNEVCTLY